METWEIVGVFNEYLSQKYAPLKLNNISVRAMMSLNHKLLNVSEGVALDELLMLDEVRHALRKEM